MNSKVLIVLIFPFALQADYQGGLDAYNRGDYLAAMREWREVTDGAPTAVSPGQFIEAHYALALLYWEGRGVRQDYKQAHDWLLQAAHLDHAGAQVKLGYLYAQGRGVEQDYEEAFFWFGKAARQGNVDGLYNLGVFYLYGHGTEPDATMARQYLASASALGDEAAELALQDLLTDARTATAAEHQDLPVSSPESAAELPFLGDDSWILGREPDHYTIQVIALSAMEKIRKLISGHGDLKPFAVYTVQKDTRPLHVLVQGDYADVAAAREARDAFPDSIQKTDALWIRQFKKVQSQIEP